MGRKREGGLPKAEYFYTQIPNWYLDEVIPKLKAGASVRVLLLILRKTYGWHKEQDAISFSQFQKLCDLACDSVTNAIKELETLNIIRVERHGKGKISVYSLVQDFQISEEEKQLAEESTPEIQVLSTPEIQVLEAGSTPEIPVTKETKELNKVENKKECAHAQKSEQTEEVFNSGEDVLIPKEASYYSNSFTPSDSGSKVRYWEKIEKRISEGKELNCNEVLSIFKKTYEKVGLGSYAVFAKHRVKMKASLTELGTFKMLKIIDYYIRNFKDVHKRLHVSGKPSVDVMLSNWLNDFIDQALNTKQSEEELLNSGVPDEFKSVMNWGRL